MKRKTFSSDQARATWRELLDTVVAGNEIVIERYNKPVAVVIPHQVYLELHSDIQVVKESQSIYQTADWESLKAELKAEIIAELVDDKNSEANWLAKWTQLKQQLSDEGSLVKNLNKEEIVSQLRQTRQEIFEAEYAHLYR